MVPSALLYRHLRRWPTMQRISLAWIAWRKGWPQRQRIQVKATEPANPWRHVIMRFWTSMLKYAQIFFGHPVSHMSHRLPLQTKKKLQKFLDSIVQKSGKIRALLRDVRQEYSRSEMMSRHHIEIDIYIYMWCMFNLQYPSGSPCSIRCMAIFASTTVPKVYFFLPGRQRLLKACLLPLMLSTTHATKWWPRGSVLAFPRSFQASIHIN